jgi:hypothetical protein
MRRIVVSILVFASMLMSDEAAIAANCLKITKWYPTELLSGNEVGTGKLQYVSAKAVKSPDFNNVYFVAVKFKASGVGNQVGVWAINGKLPQKPADLAGLSLSVNSIAQQFTVWPDADKTQARIAKNDRSSATAIKCLK